VSFWLVYQRSEWETVSLFFFFCQVEDEEEEKAPESSTIPTQHGSDFRGRSNFRGRSRGRGFRGNSDNSNSRGNFRGGRGNYRGYRGGRFRNNPRQSYNTKKSNQDDTKKDASEDATLETPQVDNHEENQQQQEQSATAPKDQRPPREKRATASTSDSRKIEEPSTTGSQPASNGTD